MDIGSYINTYWSKLLFNQNQDSGPVIGLPNTGVMPSCSAFRNDQFYWDTYFINRALLLTEYKHLVPGIIKNFFYLFERFGLVPSRNRYFNTGISQPPLLTSMVKDAYRFSGNEDFLKRGMEIASQEYERYWTNSEKVEKHNIYMGLSRYIDHYCLDLTAEHESGWDMTSRFNNQCLSYLPIDLNSLLYRYESDLSNFYLQRGSPELSDLWLQRMLIREKTMDKIMWDNKMGYFNDYNLKEEKISQFISTAQLYPLWAGLATPEQAKKTIDLLLGELRTPYGIVNTSSEMLLTDMSRQWDYPNGWANQQIITVDVLQRYGYQEEASKLMRDWISLLENVFEETGLLWEKYDVVRGTRGVDGHYPTQTGFGWTNASYVIFKHQIQQSNKSS